MIKVLREWFPKDIAEYIACLAYHSEWRDKITLVNADYHANVKYSYDFYGCEQSGCLMFGKRLIFNHRVYIQHTHVPREIHNNGKCVAYLPKNYFYQQILVND